MLYVLLLNFGLERLHLIVKFLKLFKYIDYVGVLVTISA